MAAAEPCSHSLARALSTYALSSLGTRRCGWATSNLSSPSSDADRFLVVRFGLFIDSENSARSAGGSSGSCAASGRVHSYSRPLACRDGGATTYPWSARPPTRGWFLKNFFSGVRGGRQYG